MKTTKTFFFIILLLFIANTSPILANVLQNSSIGFNRDKQTLYINSHQERLRDIIDYINKSFGVNIDIETSSEVFVTVNVIGTWRNVLKKITENCDLILVRRNGVYILRDKPIPRSALEYTPTHVKQEGQNSSIVLTNEKETNPFDQFDEQRVYTHEELFGSAENQLKQTSNTPKSIPEKNFSHSVSSSNSKRIDTGGRISFTAPEFLVVVIVVFIFWIIYRFIKRYVNKYPPSNPDTKYSDAVGGWVLWLIVMLMVVGPLLNIGTIGGSIESVETKTPELVSSQIWPLYKSAMWICTLIICMISIHTGFVLAKKRDPEAVKYAKLMLWIIGPIAYIVGFALTFVFFRSFSIKPTFVGGLIGACLWSAIWTMYLSVSKRVKATYGYIPAVNGLSHTTTKEQKAHDQQTKPYSKGRAVTMGSNRKTRLNEKQKKILFCTIGVIVAMFIYPPYHMLYKRTGGYVNSGYHFIFTNPDHWFPTVNISMLTIQIVAACLIAGILLFVLKD